MSTFRGYEFKSIEARLIDVLESEEIPEPRTIDGLRVSVAVELVDGLIGTIPLHADEARRLISSLRRAIRDLEAFQAGRAPREAPPRDPINLACSQCGRGRTLIVGDVSYCGRCAEAAGIRPRGKIE